jgi:DNA-binding transcriptional regulator of glucitol operon
LIILVIAAAATCLVLGWWQWGRFQSSNGTAQNLGYALQWPLFAGFFIWAYFRFIRLEREAQRREDASEESGAQATAMPRRPVKPVVQHELPPGLLPERPTVKQDIDPALADYNRYLAELNARAAAIEIEIERSAG